MMTPGTRVEIKNFDMAFNAVWESAKIGKWLKSVSGPRDSMPDWRVVVFNNGGRMLCHKDRIRVTDNR